VLKGIWNHWGQIWETFLYFWQWHIGGNDRNFDKWGWIGKYNIIWPTGANFFNLMKVRVWSADFRTLWPPRRNPVPSTHRRVSKRNNFRTFSIKMIIIPFSKWGFRSQCWWLVYLHFRVTQFAPRRKKNTSQTFHFLQPNVNKYWQMRLIQ